MPHQLPVQRRTRCVHPNLWNSSVDPGLYSLLFIQFSSQIQFQKKLRQLTTLWHSASHREFKPNLGSGARPKTSIIKNQSLIINSEDITLFRPKNIHFQPICALCVRPSLCKSRVVFTLVHTLLSTYSAAKALTYSTTLHSPRRIQRWCLSPGWYDERTTTSK